jgi:hypothetical protein
MTESETGFYLLVFYILMDTTSDWKKNKSKYQRIEEKHFQCRFLRFLKTLGLPV